MAPNDTCFTTDSVEQWREMLIEQHTGLSVWSVHVYDQQTACYFAVNGSDCAHLTEVIAVAETTASAHDAILYVGEFGGPA